MLESRGHRTLFKQSCLQLPAFRSICAVKLLCFTPGVKWDALPISPVLSLRGLKHDTETCDCKCILLPRPTYRTTLLPSPCHQIKPVIKSPSDLTRLMYLQVCQPMCPSHGPPPVSARRQDRALVVLGEGSEPLRDPRGKGVARPPRGTQNACFVSSERTCLPAPQGLKARNVGCSKLAAGRRAGNAGSTAGQEPRRLQPPVK